jgi:hypothetical protein
MKGSDNRLYAASSLALLMIAGYGLQMSNITLISGEVGCELRTTRNNGITLLDVVISGSGPVSGTYAFTVRRDDGSEVISQSGEFRLEGVAPFEVKKADLNLPAGDGYRASVRIEWPNGYSSCQAYVS